ncbi:hypothetical protein BT67DRAFT_151792 [Trichocladium antarcticum]|uniref:Uncharacterized protein n=1 Tax=Trichocladium antarcticum TaxID=1450529 RepID=A0AAN6ZBN8_9PEZI|nr:hypothetical protein BT67DRAFT_151792 [Trichocladium antarcticum]
MCGLVGWRCWNDGLVGRLGRLRPGQQAVALPGMYVRSTSRTSPANDVLGGLRHQPPHTILSTDRSDSDACRQLLMVVERTGCYLLGAGHRDDGTAAGRQGHSADNAGWQFRRSALLPKASQPCNLRRMVMVHACNQRRLAGAGWGASMPSARSDSSFAGLTDWQFTTGCQQLRLPFPPSSPPAHPSRFPVSNTTTPRGTTVHLQAGCCPLGSARDFALAPCRKGDGRFAMLQMLRCTAPTYMYPYSLCIPSASPLEGFTLRRASGSGAWSGGWKLRPDSQGLGTGSGG